MSIADVGCEWMKEGCCYIILKEERKTTKEMDRYGNIKEDVKLMELSIEESVNLTRDREKCRSLVEVL